MKPQKWAKLGVAPLPLCVSENYEQQGLANRIQDMQISFLSHFGEITYETVAEMTEITEGNKSRNCNRRFEIVICHARQTLPGEGRREGERYLCEREK